MLLCLNAMSRLKNFMNYFEMLLVAGSKYTCKLITGFKGVGMLIITVLESASSPIQPIRIVVVGLRLLMEKQNFFPHFHP